MNEILLILGMMAVTFGVRYPVLAIVGRFELPGQVQRALNFVPVAVLTAIVLPAMVMPDNSVDLGIDNAYLYVGILSAIIAWRTKNLLATIGIGMVIFLIWRVVLAS